MKVKANEGNKEGMNTDTAVCPYPLFVPRIKKGKIPRRSSFFVIFIALLFIVLVMYTVMQRKCAQYSRRCVLDQPTNKEIVIHAHWSS